MSSHVQLLSISQVLQIYFQYSFVFCTEMSYFLTSWWYSLSTSEVKSFPCHRTLFLSFLSLFIHDGFWLVMVPCAFSLFFFFFVKDTMKMFLKLLCVHDQSLALIHKGFFAEKPYLFPLRLALCSYSTSFLSELGEDIMRCIRILQLGVALC